MAQQLTGKVTHYFGEANVAAVKITEGQLRVGDEIGIQVTEHDEVYRIVPDQPAHARRQEHPRH